MNLYMDKYFDNMSSKIKDYSWVFGSIDIEPR